MCSAPPPCRLVPILAVAAVVAALAAGPAHASSSPGAAAQQPGVAVPQPADAAVQTGAAPAAAAQARAALEKAAIVLAEVREALGGDGRLTAVTGLQMTGTTRRAQGTFTLEGDSEVLIAPPGRFRRKESVTVGAGGPEIERTEGLNGDEFWSEVSGGNFAGRFGRGGRLGGGPAGAGQGPSPADLERLREFQRRNLQSEVSRLLLALLARSDSPVAWIGTAQAPEGTADVLEMKTPDGAATRFFVDTATRLPLMLTWTGPAGRGFAARGGRRGQGGGSPPAGPGEAAPGPVPGPDDAPPAAARGARGGAAGPPATLEMHLSEYKAVGGIKLPHLITRGVSGQTNEEWMIKSYRLNPDFKANAFTR